MFRICYLVFKHKKARDTPDARISFNQFNDEIDNQSFMGRPSAKASEIASNLDNNSPIKAIRKSSKREKHEPKMSHSYIDHQQDDD